MSREEERHNKILEAIRNAKTKEELPNANISAVTRYIANNSVFDQKKISQTEFEPVLKAILEYNYFGAPEVKEVYMGILKKLYPEKTEQEYEEKYNKMAQSSSIQNYLLEAAAKNIKLQEIKDREDLDEHNKNLKQIKDAYEIKDLPKVGMGTLNGKIMRATKNDVIEKFSIEQIREISEMMINNESEEDIQEKIYSICKTYGFEEEDTNLMYQQIESQLFMDKTIAYTIEEVQKKDKRVLEIYKLNHEETMENIKNAKRISQLPPNLTPSTLTSYLSGNTTIYPKGDKISTTELQNLTQMFFEGKNFASPEVQEEIRKIAEKIYPDKAEEAYNLLFDKLSKLPRTEYLRDEIIYSQERQEEFIGKRCSNVNVYFVPNPKSPIEGGRFYNCYINRVQNLDLGQILPLDLNEIVPPEMDVDSIEWYIQEKYDETFKAAGGIILNKDETIGNVSVFQPSDGKIGITPEEKSKYEELEELGKQVKDIIRTKKESAKRFEAYQKEYFEYQKETDDKLAELEKRIDKIIEKNDDEQR